MRLFENSESFLVLGLAAAAVLGACSSKSAGSNSSDAAVTSTGGGMSTGACQATPDGSPTSKPTASLDADAVARAAVVLGSCIPDDGIDRNATHIWTGELTGARDYFQYSRQLECVANAACGCSAVETCLGRFVRENVANCVSGCQQGVFYACSDRFDLPQGVQYSFDCSKLGLICDTAAGCVAAPVAACDVSSYSANCDTQGKPQYCDDDFLRQGPDCASLGLTCKSGECVGSGNACTSDKFGQPETVTIDGRACAGNSLTACVNGAEAVFDCSTQGPGFSCQTVGSVHFCGLSNECVPADNYSASSTTPGTCNGSVFSFCNAGRVEHIDCKSLGFAGCNVDRHNAQYGCI